MIGNEFEKIAKSKPVVITILLLTAVTAVLSFWHIRKSETASVDGVTARLCSEYLIDPTEIDEYYAELVAYRRSRAGERSAAAREHREFIETKESIWTNGLYDDDIKIITEIRSHIQKQAGFPDEIKGYIENTEKNRRTYLETGVSEDSFEYRYQESAGRLYEKVLEKVELSGEYAGGWDDFLTFRIPGLISLLGSLIIGAVVFITERENGMLPVIRSSRRGRFDTAAAKVLSALFFSVILTLAVNLAALAVFASAGMLRGASEPLQTADTFRKSFLTISLGEYCVLFFAQRIISGAVCVAVCMLTSVVFYNWIISFAASAAFVGLNYYLFSAGNSPLSAKRHINLFSLADGSLLYSRYNAINLFGFPVLFSDFCAILFPAAAAVLAIVSALIFCRRAPSSRRTAPLSRIAGFLRKVVRNRKPAASAGKRRHSLSLVSGELTKAATFRYAGVAAAALIVIGLILFPSSSTFDDNRNFSRKMYEEIILPEYEGEWTEEKHETILKRLSDDELIVSQYTQKMQDYENGLLKKDDYLSFMETYKQAQLELSSIRILAAHSEYLKSAFEENGVRGEFFADTGWNAFFRRGPDYYLFAAIIILASGLYPIEYGSRKISWIVRATKKGRAATFASKTAAAAILASVLSLVSETVMLILASSRLSLSHAAAPALSIERLGGLESGISVAGYLALYVLTRVAGAALLSITVAALSGITRNVLAAAAAATAVALIPSVSGSTAEIVAKIDFMRFFEADRVMIFSVSSETMPDFLPLILIALAITAGAGLLTSAAGARFTSRP